MRSYPTRAGVSLIELIVVVSFITVLLAMALHGVQSARSAASRTACQNNLRQIGLAALQYESVNKTLPPDFTLRSRPGAKDYFTWCLILCPYLEQESVYRSALESAKMAFPYDASIHPGLKQVVKVFTCPADTRLASPITDEWGVTAAYCSYVGNSGSHQRIINFPPEPNFSYGTIMLSGGYNRGVTLTSITDGTSMTICFGERPPPAKLLSGSWYSPIPPDHLMAHINWHAKLSLFAREYPNSCLGESRFGPGRIENDCDSFHYWSLHSSGANFVFADGSVRFLTYAQSDILPALATRASGEIANLD